jgi:hypothetical protein
MIGVAVDTSKLAGVLERLETLAAAGNYQAEIGWLENTPPEIKRRAFLMEYRMAARPGYGGGQNPPTGWAILRRTKLYIEQNLERDVNTLLSLGFSGRELMEQLATMYKETLIEYLLSVTDPPLKESTKRWKEWRKEHGLSDPDYPAEKIWVDTAETLDAIDAQVVPAGEK